MGWAAGGGSVRAQVKGLTPHLAEVATDGDQAPSSAPRLRLIRWTAPKVVPADTETNRGAQPHAHPQCHTTWPQLTWQRSMTATSNIYILQRRSLRVRQGPPPWGRTAGQRQKQPVTQSRVTSRPFRL